MRRWAKLGVALVLIGVVGAGISMDRESSARSAALVRKRTAERIEEPVERVAYFAANPGSDPAVFGAVALVFGAMAALGVALVVIDRFDRD